MALHLDREFPMMVFRKLLLKLTDPTVRIGLVHVEARFDNTPAERVEDDVGFLLRIDPALPLTTVRFRAEETAVDLVLRDSEEAVFGEDLAATLKALHVLAQQEGLRVVLDLREEQVPETRWGLELEGKPVSLPGLQGKVKTDIELEVWR